MALVITLILLAVILVMIIALLAVARRERASVGTATDATTARLASDAALAAAQSQIIANIKATNAAQFSYSLMVSTNYLNSYGFVPNSANPTNVNYNYYYDAAGPVSGADFLQNVANLQILPRAPVMVSAAEPVGRYYLDLNRNGTFENSGTFGSLVDENGNTNAVTPYQLTGDPQWIGQLQNPGTVHAADNKFLYRYAYIVLPVGQSLDVNYDHNESRISAPSPLDDLYLRNQGIGSWEINLAGFLADLDTNLWYENPTNTLISYYDYEPATPFAQYTAFDDALSLVRWRYNYPYASYASVPPLSYSLSNSLSLEGGPADLFPLGPIATNTAFPYYSYIPATITARPWPGSTYTNRFSSQPSDLFDTNKSSIGFVDRLTAAGTTFAGNGAQPTYDRYTFYRMLDQLGTDTLPGDAGKMNLNYDNLDGSGNVIPGAETNLISWTTESGGALRFFTNAADRLLKIYSTNWFQAGPTNYLITYFGIAPANATYSYTTYNNGIATTNYNDPNGFGLTNVPVYGMTNQIPALSLAGIPVQVNGQFVYSPAINRLLQLAANLYDASTNAAYPNPGFFPSVFRPTFLVTNQNGIRNVYINGYQQVTGVSGTSDPQLVNSITMGSLPLGLSSSTYGVNGVNVLGIPWIIGAKKYMPNFNTFYSYDTISVTRKVQVGRPTNAIPWTRSNSSQYYTNQMFVLGVTNFVGVSFWNSYANQYPGGSPTVVASCAFFGRLTQTNGTLNMPINYALTPFPLGNQPMNTWPGTGVAANSNAKYQTPNNSSFVAGALPFTLLGETALVLDNNGNVTGFDPTQSFIYDTSTSLAPFPDLQVTTTNYFQGYVIDGNHVLDYVSFSGPALNRSVTNDIADFAYPDNLYHRNQAMQWSMNDNPSGVNYGLIDQLTVSQTDRNVPTTGPWKPIPIYQQYGLNSPQVEANFFFAYFTGGIVNNSSGTPVSAASLTVLQAPYTPQRTAVTPVVWLANDPLVHYLPSDLNDQVPASSLSPSGAYPNDDGNTNNIGYPSLVSVSQTIPITQRYQPWSQISQMAGVRVPVDTNSINLAYKDPGVYTSDNWDFPGSKYPSVGWIGRVHRGTPWQTVYLKATNIYTAYNNTTTYTGSNTWSYWSGNFNPVDAVNSLPLQDEYLFDIFTATPNDNAGRGTLSVNQKNLAAWSALFSGMVVPTNPVTGYQVIPPAGVDVANSYVGQLYSSITNARARRPNGVFRHVGEVMQAPALAQFSPFLSNLNGGTQVSDELSEWLPQQMMGLVRLDSQPRYVIYSFGQTLKPAPAGTVLSSQFYGLVTNYQVAAESATRAVVTVQPSVTYQVINGVTVPVTNYTTKVESFSVLPPQ
ncbi:MAG TPA: hypothetical protein VK742_19400 [Candidatus Sulfotelmatobacter sp.]|nr:hypothetical protein [Candidatus Sulfotelmatobacter sp.]